MTNGTAGVAYMLVTTKDGQQRRASSLYYDHEQGKTFARLASDVPGYQGDYVEVTRGEAVPDDEVG